jgi:hypothetical protein
MNFDLTPMQERELNKLVSAAIIDPSSASTRLHELAAQIERRMAAANLDHLEPDQIKFNAYFEAAGKLHEEIERNIRRKIAELNSNPRMSPRARQRKLEAYGKEQQRSLRR